MNYFKSPRGSITIFQLIIFSALLLLTGVLVDAVRIMAAERTVQSAVNTAVRSTLAEYDEQLAGDYGLFAIDASAQETKLKEHFLKYLNHNISDNNKKFRFIDYEVNTAQTEIAAKRNLLDNDDNALKEQIIEYMKYKAPITITKNVIDKLLASGIFKKKEFAVKEKDVRLSSKEVKKISEKADSDMNEINSETKGIQSYTVNILNENEFFEQLKRLKSGYENLSGTLNTLVSSLEDYGQKAQVSKNFGEKANGDENLQGDAAISLNGAEFENAQESIKRSQDITKSSSQSLDSLLLYIEPLHNQVVGWNNSMQSLIAANEGLRSLVLSLQLQKGGNNGKQIENLMNQIIKNNEKIFELREKIEKNIAEINRLKGIFQPGEFSKLQMNPASEAKEKYAKEAPDKGANNAKLEDLKGKLEKYITGKAIKDEWLLSAQDFKNAEFENLIMKMQNKMVSENEETAEADNEEIFKFIDNVKAAMNSGMENIFVAEYILDRFTYHTSLAERGHYFEKGEVEYILWGAKQQNINIAASVSSIGFFRFAVDTIDYFATSKIPHPVLRLVYAVGKGLAQAFKDSYDLYQGRQIPIIPSLNNANVSFKLNYAEHLRLFLLMQSISDPRAQLNNIRQLIQVNLKNPDEGGSLQNPEFQLGKYRTVLKGKAEVKINLWFLPMLQLDKLNHVRFEGGKYKITKEISIGY